MLSVNVSSTLFLTPAACAYRRRVLGCQPRSLPVAAPGSGTCQPSRRQNSLPLFSDTVAAENLVGDDAENYACDLKRYFADDRSLADPRRRAPACFPGAVGPRFPSPDDHLRLGQSLRAGGVSRDDILWRALEVRRAVAAETLRDALRAGKLSINYSRNLVDAMPEFVDLVVIEAAAMKKDSELAHLSFNARAKSYIQNSGVVALVKWLKHNSMTYPQIGKVMCSCTGNLEKVRQIAEWLKSVHVKGGFLGHVLVKGGSVLGRTIEELEGMVDYLESKGVKKEWMGHVLNRCPQVLGLSMQDLEMRVTFYVDTLGINEKHFGPMVFEYPKVLGFFSLVDMNSKVEYLKEFGLSNDDIGHLFAHKPQLMACSIEERWKRLVKYLYYLGISRDGMKRILVVQPVVFCLDLEKIIAPKVKFLQEIGVRTDAIGAVLVKFPSILTSSLYKKLRPLVIFLLTKAGVKQENVGKVIALDPQLVSCSIVHKLEINVKYFLSLGIRLHLLGEMIADFPMLLRYNLEVLRPKYCYLRRVMVRPLKDLIEFPRYLSYSLEGRIEPRHRILVENRINMKLRYMLAGSDEEFNQRVCDAVQRRVKFESSSWAMDSEQITAVEIPPCALSVEQLT